MSAFERTDTVLAQLVLDNGPRILDILETWARRPPIVVATSASPQADTGPRATNVDAPPKSIDGEHFRYRLMGGGYLIEDMRDRGRFLFFEDVSGNKVELVPRDP